MSTRRYVFVCSQHRPAGHPKGCCAGKGSNEVLQAFWAELQKRNAYDTVQATFCGCLGPCHEGPNVIVFPEAVVYSGVKPADVMEIFDTHLQGGRIVQRLAPANGGATV